MCIIAMFSGWRVQEKTFSSLPKDGGFFFVGAEEEEEEEEEEEALVCLSGIRLFWKYSLMSFSSWWSNVLFR